MLVNSFSYLPVLIENRGNLEWRLISDFRLGQFLRKNGKNVKERLTKTLEECLKSGEIELHLAGTCNPQDKIEEIMRECEGMPILVLAPDRSELLGILTAFDLL